MLAIYGPTYIPALGRSAPCMVNFVMTMHGRTGAVWGPSDTPHSHEIHYAWDSGRCPTKVGSSSNRIIHWLETDYVSPTCRWFQARPDEPRSGCSQEDQPSIGLST